MFETEGVESCGDGCGFNDGGAVRDGGEDGGDGGAGEDDGKGGVAGAGDGWRCRQQ